MQPEYIRTKKPCKHCTEDEEDDPSVVLVKEPDGDVFCPNCYYTPGDPHVAPDDTFVEELRELRRFLHEEKHERKKCVAGFINAYFDDEGALTI